MIVHGNVSDANALHHYGMLALPRQIEHQRFASGSLGLTKTCDQQNTGEQSKQTNSVHREAPFSRQESHRRVGHNVDGRTGIEHERFVVMAWTHGRLQGKQLRGRHSRLRRFPQAILAVKSFLKLPA
jgi:hypothetical protein